MNDWPPSTKPYRANPPEGAVGIVLPIRDDLRFFKLCYHSLLAFTDYRFMLTVVDTMSGYATRQYLESIRRNHHINVLQYQKEYNLAAAWNLGLRFMFSFSTVKYGVVLTPTVILQPYWLSALVRALDGYRAAGAITPISNGSMADLVLFHREIFEKLNGFDETRVEPDAFLARAITDIGRQVPQSDSVYVHKFKVNGFDPKRVEPETADVTETQEANA